MRNPHWIGCAVVIAACGGSHAPSIAATAPEVKLEGRFETTSSGVVRMGYPGSAAWLRFHGTTASVVLGEHSLENDEYGQPAYDIYDVFVDGQLASTFTSREGVQSYPLASGLAAGDHTVVLRKRTEAFVGIGELHGFDADGPAIAPTLPPHKLEFVGDSIAAGFGVDGADASCLFSATTENYDHAFAALTAQALDAQQVSVAVSGAGLYRNWHGTTDYSIADLFQRTLPTDVNSHWSFSGYTPDAVVIAAGAADFTSGNPGHDPFTAGAKRILAAVRAAYPQALIVVTVSPMLSDLWPAGAQARTDGSAWLTEVVTGVNAAGDANVKLLAFPSQDNAASYGCKSHPSVATQAQLAQQLAAMLKAELHW